MGYDMGMVGKEGSGQLRVNKKEQKLLSKKRQRVINAGSSGATNGLASSLAFTPVQGIELMNPHAEAQKIKEANAKYFGSNSGFKQ
jgi:U4/U6 small nuclear ribonucleoprotein PRP31